MKGGVRLYIWWLLPDEGWCETLHLMTFTWWRVVWDFTSDDFYLMKGGVRLYIWWLLPDEGWCETLHLMTFTWWRVVWDFTSDDFVEEVWCETLHLMTFAWWRVVWDFTSDDFCLMKGGVRLYIWWLLPDEGWCETLHLMTFTWWRVVWDFTSDDFYLMKCGVRLYIWWLLPDEGWCETLHLMTFAWWRVVWDFTSDDFYLMKCAVRLHGNGCMNVAWGLCWGRSRSTKPCVFPCKVAAGGDEGQLVCEAVAGTLVLMVLRFCLFHPWCSALCMSLCVRSSMRLRNPWLQIALEWLHQCCMGFVLGKKPEHETVCFSV